MTSRERTCRIFTKKSKRKRAQRKSATADIALPLDNGDWFPVYQKKKDTIQGVMNHRRIFTRAINFLTGDYFLRHHDRSNALIIKVSKLIKLLSNYQIK